MEKIRKETSRLRLLVDCSDWQSRKIQGIYLLAVVLTLEICRLETIYKGFGTSKATMQLASSEEICGRFIISLAADATVQALKIQVNNYFFQ